MKVYLILIFIIISVTGCSFKSVTVDGTVYADANKNQKSDDALTLSGVIVRSGNEEVLSDGSGKFSLSGEVVDEGASIKLFFYKAGYKDTFCNVNLSSDKDSGVLGPQNDISISMETN